MGIKMTIIDPFLQEFTGGVDTTEVTGHTVAECLDGLENQFPGIKKKLGREQGVAFSLFPDILVCVNSIVLDQRALSTPVKDGDEVAIGIIAFGG